ncbi:Integrin beta-like protein 1 [Amphibalanus amphitrite]|uniref:Integrin beta-like protein 1 n=1 Tax=Amphibalanus amphitrite TaxID=1232801 RepID=A0A6A4W4I2_AMPAM|nr:Integrin beta-like protein 1 [Amphibalanus amphitrite]
MFLISGLEKTPVAALPQAHAVGPAADCSQFTSCRDCADSSATCAWCSDASSAGRRCVSLLAPLGPGASCSPCEEDRVRVAREVDTCDDSRCRGVDGRLCSGHGTCDCGTCTCETGYTGRVCQNCPFKWDDCPSSDETFSSCCNNMNHCFDWPARCARCMRNERNVTLCDMCPRDTRLVTSDPGEPRSAECVFDSVSFSSNLHCSYHVYYWHGDPPALELHSRVQLVCGSAADKTIFPKRKEKARPAAPKALPTPLPATTEAPSKAPQLARPRAPPVKPREEAAAGTTERPDETAKQAAGAPAVLCQMTVLLCSGWVLLCSGWVLAGLR